MLHEIYHFLEFRYAIVQNTHNNNLNFKQIHEDISTCKYSKEILLEALHSCGFSYEYDIIENEISTYATTNYSEAIAEAGSSGHSRLCKEIIKLVNKKWR